MLLDESIKITACKIASFTQADCCDTEKQSNPCVGAREGSGREGLLEGVVGVGEAEGVVKIGDLDGSEGEGCLVGLERVGGPEGFTVVVVGLRLGAVADGDFDGDVVGPHVTHI